MPPLSAEEIACAEKFFLQAHDTECLGKDFGVMLARERNFAILAYEEDGLAEEIKQICCKVIESKHPSWSTPKVRQQASNYTGRIAKYYARACREHKNETKDKEFAEENSCSVEQAREVRVKTEAQVKAHNRKQAQKIQEERFITEHGKREAAVAAASKISQQLSGAKRRAASQDGDEEGDAEDEEKQKPSPSSKDEKVNVVCKIIDTYAKARDAVSDDDAFRAYWEEAGALRRSVTLA